jgi:hypothetical protein
VTALLALLRADPNVSSAFKDALSGSAERAVDNLLRLAAVKQGRRRFLAEPEPLTGFGSIDTTSDEYHADMQQDRIDAQDAKDAREERGIR